MVQRVEAIRRTEIPGPAEPLRAGSPRSVEQPKTEQPAVVERPSAPVEEPAARRPVPAPEPEETIAPLIPAGPSSVPAQGKPIQVMLNGQSLILPGKEEGVPYYVMDLLEHSGIDFDNLDRGVELQVNGSNCSFTQELRPRDDVVIRYLEK